MKGLEIFFKIFNKIEIEFEKIYFEKVTMDKIGVLLEWQQEFVEFGEIKTARSNVSKPTMSIETLQRNDSMLIMDKKGVKIMTKESHKNSPNVSNILCLLGIPSTEDEVNELEVGAFHKHSPTRTRSHSTSYNKDANSSKISAFHKKISQKYMGHPQLNALRKASLDDNNRRIINEIDQDLNNALVGNVDSMPGSKKTTSGNKLVQSGLNSNADIIIESRLKRSIKFLSCIVC